MKLLDKIKIEMEILHINSLESVGSYDKANSLLVDLELEAEIQGYNSIDENNPYEELNVNCKELKLKLVNAWNSGIKHQETIVTICDGYDESDV